MKRKRTTLFRIGLASILTFGVFALALGGYYSSAKYIFEKETGGHFLGLVEPEIQGVYAHKCLTPTDNYYSTQKSYSMNMLGDIESVWDNYTGEGVTVAVIDDGFDHDHPEYVRADNTSVISQDSAYFYASGYSYGVQYYKNNPSCIDEDWDSDYNEWATHGTNTSTTALAPIGNNGVVGIAPGATLLALKIDMSFAAIKGAIEYAISKGADIINMSLGAFAESFTDGFGDQQTGSSSVATYLNSVCTSAYNEGVIVVAAAGNEATWHKSYPACNSHVIGVGALYKNNVNKLAPFTNYISTSQTGEVNVDILAPGFVYAAGVGGSSSSSHTATYNETQGTSFSSPIVAGAAALWKQKYPNGTPDQFETALTNSAAGIGSYESKYVPVRDYYGSSYTNQGPSNLTCGRLDVGALMDFSSEATGITISPSEVSGYHYASGKTKTTQLEVRAVEEYAEAPEVIWTSSDTNVATVSNSGLLTYGYKAGTATITATSVSSDLTATCSVSVDEYISPTSISISNKNISMEVGETYTVNDATVLPSNATDQDIMYESDDSSIATAIDNKITGVAVGSTTVTAAVIDDDADDFVTETINVTVTPSTVTDATFNFANESQVTSSSDTVITWQQGVATFKDEKNTGSSFAGTQYRSNPLRIYSGNKATISVPSPATLTSISISINEGPNYLTGATWTNATVSVSGSTATVTPNSSVNEVSFKPSGQVRLNSVTVHYSNGETVDVTGVSLSETSANIATGGKLQLTATVAPNNASDQSVTWASSNTSVATVSNGLVTGVSAGTATITVTTNDGGFAANCQITVSDVLPTSISLDKSNLSIGVNEGSTSLTATISPSNATNKTVTWTSSDESVATVSNGTITPLKEGTTTITASTHNNLTATCLVTVTAQAAISGTATYTVTSRTAVSSSGVPSGSGATFSNTYNGNVGQITSGNSMTLTLSGYAGLAITGITLSMHSNATKGSGSFNATVGTTNIASLSTTGFNSWYNNTSYGDIYRNVIVTLTNPGYVVKNNENVVITIAATVNSLYCQSFSIAYSSEVEAYPTAITLPITAKTLDKGETFQLSPVVTMSDNSAYSGSIDYASSDTNIATVSSSGLITAVNKGSTTITASVDTLNASLALTVTWDDEPLLDSISVSNAPTSIPFKGTLDTSNIVVTAHYTHDGADQNVTSNAVISSISTDSIGTKTIDVSYTEGDITKHTSFDVFVTNVGATRTETPVSGESTTYGTCDKSNYWGSNNSSLTLNGASFTLSAQGTTFFGGDASKGSQIGSGNSPASSVTISTSDIAGSITAIQVFASGASSVNATLSVSVGGVAFETSSNSNTVSLTATNTGYTFSGSSSGQIVISYANSSSKALYFQKIIVTTAGGTTYSWAGDEQATSFVNYLSTFEGSCAEGFASRDAVKQLVTEYNALIDDAKSSTVFDTEISDIGGMVLPVTKLKMMVQQYNATLEQGEIALTLELPQMNYTGQNKMDFAGISQNSNFVGFMIILLSGALGLTFIALRKRHQ